MCWGISMGMPGLSACVNDSPCQQARASPPGLRYRLQLALLGGHLLRRGHGHARFEHMPVALQMVQHQQPRPRRNAHLLQSTAQTPTLCLDYILCAQLRSRQHAPVNAVDRRMQAARSTSIYWRAAEGQQHAKARMQRKRLAHKLGNHDIGAHLSFQRCSVLSFSIPRFRFF